MEVPDIPMLIERWMEALDLDSWTVWQIVLIALGFGLSTWAARRIEPALESRARRIKGNPDLLRMVIAVMRRMRWLFLVLWLWIARAVLIAVANREEFLLLQTAITLVAAWFLISVLTRLIRNLLVARTVAILIWTYVALQTLGLDQPLARTLDQAALTVGGTRLTLLLAVKALVLVVSLIWLAAFTGNLVSHWVQRSTDLSPSFKVLISKLIKIALILLAIAIGLSATGIDLTALTVFSGAVGVGVGFGLQKVVSNFISGIIILLDKSIKPGDTITLGDTFGWIRELRTRFVSVITRDGKEYLIPNEDFISQQVVNWSFSSDYVRIDVDFGTAYDSDPHEVVRIAIEAAEAVPRVANDYKKPVCWLIGFGESSLDFRLRFWISDPSHGLTNIRGQVLMGLWDAFKAADIDIPFPHREIIMRTPVEVAPSRQEETTRQRAQELDLPWRRPSAS